MPQIVVEKARLVCIFGTATCPLHVTSKNTGTIGNGKQGSARDDLAKATTLDDNVPANISQFGTCTKKKLPCEGLIKIDSGWENASSGAKVGDGNLLRIGAVCSCVQGGIIGPIECGHPGDVTEGANTFPDY